jgi:hypothetical protein
MVDNSCAYVPFPNTNQIHACGRLVLIYMSRETGY